MKTAIKYLPKTLFSGIIVAVVYASLYATGSACAASPAAHPTADDASLLQADHAAFASGKPGPVLNGGMLDADFTWTDSSGRTRNKTEILETIRSGEKMAEETGKIASHVYGQVGIVQESDDKVYVLRVWIKRSSQWQLIVYHAVSIGAPASSSSDNERCKNPCVRVPFHPQDEEEARVIHTYQAVERAVTAHDSAAWGSHIADEFFAVTSNSNRPVDKQTRRAGLDQQKVGGIAPFPLVSARMFEFADVMVMISRQQPLHGLPLHVTRVWLKRNNEWVEAYSYQTTIQDGNSSR